MRRQDGIVCLDYLQSFPHNQRDEPWILNLFHPTVLLGISHIINSQRRTRKQNRNLSFHYPSQVIKDYMQLEASYDVSLKTPSFFLL